jgi:hypothetical protein
MNAIISAYARPAIPSRKYPAHPFAHKAGA